MPAYEYRCPACGVSQDAYRRVDERDDCPPCRCGMSTERRITATMVAVFRPYLPVAGEREDGERRMIRTKAEHEAFLRRNGYEEVGNDRSMAPPSDEEIAKRRASWQDAPDAPMVDVEKLKREGFIAEDLTT